MGEVREMLTQAKLVAEAWHNVTGRWIVRRNKMHNDGKQWEVVHDWGGDLISDDTQKVLRRYGTEERAERFARECEDEARGNAVLEVLYP
jgi:hypothetical protein